MNVLNALNYLPLVKQFVLSNYDIKTSYDFDKLTLLG